MTQSETKIHFAYVTGILLAAIVALATVKWGQITDLVAYLNFALTTASLLLAVVAIGYAMSSGATFLQHLGGIREATDTMKGAAQEVSASTGRLEERVLGLPALISGVGERVDATHEMLRAQMANPLDAASDSTVGPLELRGAVDVVGGSAAYGRLVWLAAAEALDAGVAFTMDELVDALLPTASTARPYFLGWFMAGSALGAITMTSKLVENRTAVEISMKSMNLELKSEVQRAAESVSAGDKEAKGAWGPANITAIRSFFRSPERGPLDSAPVSEKASPDEEASPDED